MRWSCPHCGVNLAVGDDKIGSGWAFSRCYKCAGFALVRKSDVNLVKVDKAPVGERVILPEAAEEPMMNQEATRRLAQVTKPMIKPSARKNASATNSAPTMPVLELRKPGTNPASNYPGNQSDYLNFGFPEPIRESASMQNKLRQKILPVVIGAAGAVSIGSGIYLYLEGQALWQKARSTAAMESARAIAAQNAVRHAQITVMPALTQPTAPAVIAPAAPAVASVTTIAPSMLARAELHPVTDVLHQSAMAPARTNADTGSTLPMTVRTKGEKAHIHSGPGLKFPIIRDTDPSVEYVVTQWSDRWFKIANNSGPGIGWIRNDLVEAVDHSP